MKEKYNTQLENNRILQQNNRKLEILFTKGDNSKKKELIERVEYYRKEFEDLENKYSKNDYNNERIMEISKELDEVKNESDKFYDQVIRSEGGKNKNNKKSEDGAYAELEKKCNILKVNNKKLNEKVEFHQEAYYKKLNELNDYIAQNKSELVITNTIETQTNTIETQIDLEDDDK
eukprot:SAG11_NODE_11269_length_771_cov_28.571429_1_plen_175_part_10